MRLLDLFSGIGGFSLAAQWVWGDELEIVAFCECDKFCQKVLHKHWPDVPIIEDVKDVTLIADSERLGWTAGTRKEIQSKEQEAIRPKFRDICTKGIDLLTGGFPCQPFSVAGKRKGKEDNRFLWPEMFSVIKEVRPRWVVAENVAGIVRMALDDCLSDLESEGYSTQAIIIPACSVNAPHRRDRVWIVAWDTDSMRCNRDSRTERGFQNQNSIGNGIRQDVADTERGQSREQTKSEGREDSGRGSEKISPSNDDGMRMEGQRAKQQTAGIDKYFTDNWWSTEPDVGRVAHGVPNRVDRLKSLGNAIVPQVAVQIFRAIKEIDEGGVRCIPFLQIMAPITPVLSVVLTQ